VLPETNTRETNNAETGRKIAHTISLNNYKL